MYFTALAACLLRAGVDFVLRCLLLGHVVNRPDYGAGGAMAYRAAQLLDYLVGL
ncbi:hypothetical protein [Polycladidibacter stylochi]|uniref:hypothetical protein n=1 Tax=Polycladidibacter stylochi TaxID=1807766 RepID=UPI000A9CA082|nr:hypothetical protein [Pseudovibrio stylochi]